MPVTFEEEARELLAVRVRSGVAWGWKEPRTTLFLDFWQERLPDARHLFVFQRPWEVVDSLFRRGDDTFVRNPAFAQQEARRDAERKALQRPMAVIKRGLRQIPAVVLRPCAALGTLIRRGRRPESPATEPPLQVFPRVDQPPPAEYAA